MQALKLCWIALLLASLVHTCGARSAFRDEPEKPWGRTVVAEPTPTAKQKSSLRGKASWYCKAGVSACHAAHPPGSMVAAACTDLRAAIGPHWRGKVVTVSNRRGVAITVTLVDWCASTDKLIDLYAAAFSAVAPLYRGVSRVEVSW